MTENMSLEDRKQNVIIEVNEMLTRFNIDPSEDGCIAEMRQVLEKHFVPEDVKSAAMDIVETYYFNKSLPYFGQPEHPQGYDNICGCDTCMSYA